MATRKTVEARARAAAPQYPYTIQARVAPRHYAVLLAWAEAHDCGVSEALRLLLEQHVDEVIPPEIQQLGVSEVRPDPAWVAKHGDDDAS